MKRALLVSGLTLAVLFLAAQAVPNRYTVSQTLNFLTDLNVETLKADVVDAGTLIVTGTSTLEGDVTANAALSVAGASTLTGNVTAAGTLDVTGATTCTDLTASGDVTANNLYAGDGGFSRNLDVVGDLAVTGASTLTGDVGISGHTNMQDAGAFNVVANGALSVTGDTTLTGHTTAGDGGVFNWVVNGALDVTGASTFTGDVSAGYVLAGDGGVHDLVMTGALSARVVNVVGLDDGGTKGLFFPAQAADALPAAIYSPYGANPAAPGGWQFCESEWCTASIILDGQSTNATQILDEQGFEVLINNVEVVGAHAGLWEVAGHTSGQDGGWNNAVFSGTLNVTGDSALGYVLAGDAGVRNVAASGTLNVTGDSTLGYVLAADAGANNIISTGTLGVTGDSTLGYVLAADAGANNLVLTGTLGVTGDATLGYVLGADAGFNAIIATGNVSAAKLIAPLVKVTPAALPTCDVSLGEGTIAVITADGAAATLACMCSIAAGPGAYGWKKFDGTACP